MSTSQFLRPPVRSLLRPGFPGRQLIDVVEHEPLRPVEGRDTAVDLQAPEKGWNRGVLQGSGVAVAENLAGIVDRFGKRVRGMNAESVRESSAQLELRGVICGRTAIGADRARTLERIEPRLQTGNIRRPRPCRSGVTSGLPSSVANNRV